MNELNRIIKEVPLVSIVCITYNHEKYIAQALEGFVIQKTNFPFEIIVHDDASTDNTAKIIKEYETKCPLLFSNIYQTENQYTKKNSDVSRIALNIAKGKYIALCEGDDYWIDPLKLQKQVDFLEGNPDYGMAYSKVKVYIEKDKQFKKYCFGKSILSFEDLLLGNYIPTPTVLFRREIYFSYIEEIQPNQKQWLMGDYPIWLWIATKNKIKFFNDAFSVYRILESSATHSNFVKRKIQLLNSFIEIKFFFMNKYGYEFLEKQIWQQYFTMKTNIFIMHNKGSISELRKEMTESKVQTTKIRIILFILNFAILRRMLLCYWTMKV